MSKYKNKALGEVLDLINGKTSKAEYNRCHPETGYSQMNMRTPWEEDDFLDDEDHIGSMCYSRPIIDLDEIDYHEEKYNFLRGRTQTKGLNNLFKKEYPEEGSYEARAKYLCKMESAAQEEDVQLFQNRDKIIEEEEKEDLEKSTEVFIKKEIEEIVLRKPDKFVAEIDLEYQVEKTNEYWEFKVISISLILIDLKEIVNPSTIFENKLLEYVSGCEERYTVNKPDGFLNFDKKCTLAVQKNEKETKKTKKTKKTKTKTKEKTKKEKIKTKIREKSSTPCTHRHKQNLLDYNIYRKSKSSPALLVLQSLKQKNCILIQDFVKPLINCTEDKKDAAVQFESQASSPKVKKYLEFADKTKKSNRLIMA